MPGRVVELGQGRHACLTRYPNMPLRVGDPGVEPVQAPLPVGRREPGLQQAGAASSARAQPRQDLVPGQGRPGLEPGQRARRG